MKKKWMLLFLLVSCLLCSCAGEETEQYEIVEPRLESDQSMGAAILLDYEGNDKIVFHGEFGLFVYDTKEEKMLKMLDLKPIGCDIVQGSNCCDVRVTEDGEEIYISRLEDNEYVDMFVYIWKEDLLYKTAYIQDVPGKTFYDYKENKGVLTEGSIGEIGYKAGNKEIKLFCELKTGRESR